jgi:hypothetical protein
MQQQILPPSMQNGNNADLGAKPFGLAATSSSVAEAAANSRL